MKIKVRYKVTFETEIEIKSKLKPGVYNLEEPTFGLVDLKLDKVLEELTDLDIPETDDVKYVSDSFEVLLIETL